MRWKRANRFVAVPLSVILVGSLALAALHRNIDPYRDYGAPHPQEPNPNAYDLYLKAHQAFKADKNDQAWSLMERAKGAESCYPTAARDAGQYLSFYRWPFQDLGDYLQTAGSDLDTEGKTDEGLNYFLDDLKMASAVQHGAGLLEFSHSSRIEPAARKWIIKLLPRLSAPAARQGALRLEAILNTSEPYDKIVENERWVEYFIMADAQHGHRRAVPPIFVTHPEWGFLGTFIAYCEPPKTLAASYMNSLVEQEELASKPWIDFCKTPVPAGINPDLAKEINAIRFCRLSYNRDLAMNRIVSVLLAIRAYSIEKAHLPAKLAELRPRYLRELPVDPFTGRQLLYQPTNTKYRIWSAGPNTVDDNALQVPSKAWNRSLLTYSDFLTTKGDIVYIIHCGSPREALHQAKRPL